MPAGSVVVIDEAGMLDTKLLHEYSRIAQAKNWRTILVGDHRQIRETIAVIIDTS